MSRLQSSLTSGALVAATILVLAGCARPGVSEKELEPTVASRQTYSYSNDIKPILDQKCIACHACYDAPCQLKLTSGEGLLRGGTGKPVYDGARITNAEPTRLFVDAQGQAQWREKGFHSVLNDRGGSLDDNLANSLLFRMIELGREHPLPANSPVPEEIALGLARENECPVPGEFDKYAHKKPQQGMPLAMAGLSDREYETLRQWVFEGAVIDEQPWQPDAAEQRQHDQEIGEITDRQDTPRHHIDAFRRLCAEIAEQQADHHEDPEELLGERPILRRPGLGTVEPGQEQRQ